MATRKGLGKGLGALIEDFNDQPAGADGGAVRLPLQKIEPNPLQPRKTFDPEELDSLADCVTFGVAPSAILFWVMHEVHCPEVLMPLKGILPYSAFLLAAFSALRLAKFNLDTRQSTQFIGLPTPANALFWGSLVLGQHAFLTSLRFNIVWLIALTLLFCYLLVCEVPMMALKFKELTWQALRWKVVFLVGCLCFIPLGYSAFAAIIVWYIFLSVVLVKLHQF